MTVYNFEVEGAQTYFVADGVGAESFVWVHNASGYDEASISSQHYSVSAQGRSLAGTAFAARKKMPKKQQFAGDYWVHRKNRNIAVADVEIDGVRTRRVFLNTPQSMHSEQHLVAWYERMSKKGRKVKVLGVYSDGAPCGPDRANCAGVLAKKFGASVPVYHTRKYSGPME